MKHEKFLHLKPEGGLSLTHGSLFSGIGGFDLAAEWMGWNNLFQCEIDEFCLKVLNKNFPTVKKYTDIKQFNGNEYRYKLDVLTGGFPCQPFSTAGKRKGTEDNRSLWPEMFRIIKEAKPKFVIAENVVGIATMELDNILFDLEGEGYQTTTFNIPACAKSAPHIRKRIWIVANINSRGWNTQSRICTGTQERNSANDADCTNAVIGKQKTWLAEPNVERVVYGVSRKLDKSRIKALGNSIVPQVAFELFRAVGVLNAKTLHETSI